MKTFRFSLIKKFREESGLSQTDFAERVGVSPQQLWNWENCSDSKSLTTGALAKIADALGRKTDDFFVDERTRG